MKYVIQAHLVALALGGPLGCETAHPDRDHAVPVAIWSSVQLVGSEAPFPSVQTRHRVADVLRSRGLEARVDGSGVSVSDEQVAIAREVLLTDDRLRDTDVKVIILVPAGSARKTAYGVEIPTTALAGDQVRQ